MSLHFPAIWSLIDSFKERCRLRDWETCETGDWIKTEDGDYHLFLWTRTIHLSTFEKIATHHRSGVNRGNDYDVVEVTYTCWLFHDKPPDFLLPWIKENIELAQKNAIFDLSAVYSGKNVCRKVNETGSRVFNEFEKFLEENWGIKFEPVGELPALRT